MTGAARSVTDVLAARADGRLLELATSGTTGEPRTVTRTPESWWSSFPAYSDLTGVDAGARVWIPGPATSTMNLFAAVHARAVGGTVVSDPAAATHACLTPTALDRHAGRLRRGTRVVVGGAALPPRQHERATAAGLTVRSYYGAAELSFVAAGEHADDLHPFPGVVIEIREDMIWVSSPYLARGLGSWATAGDRGRFEGDRLVVLGRPGTATTAGATVSLGMIEARLQAHAHSPIAVVALPHASLGEVVAAVVTASEDVPALRAVSRDLLPVSHRPRRWLTVDALPVTVHGKVDHGRLRAALLEASR